VARSQAASLVEGLMRDVDRREFLASLTVATTAAGLVPVTGAAARVGGSCSNIRVTEFPRLPDEPMG
jgi:hypothetical protein